MKYRYEKVNDFKHDIVWIASWISLEGQKKKKKKERDEELNLILSQSVGHN